MASRVSRIKPFPLMVNSRIVQNFNCEHYEFTFDQDVRE